MCALRNMELIHSLEVDCNLQIFWDPGTSNYTVMIEIVETKFLNYIYYKKNVMYASVIDYISR